MSITNHVSIFEIVAADNLSQELRLSLRHVIGVILRRNYFNSDDLILWENELSALVSFLTQFLASNDALLAEMFYGIGRVSAKKTEAIEVESVLLKYFPISNVRVSLFLSVLLPHLQSKLFEIYSKMKRVCVINAYWVDATSLNMLNIFVLKYPLFSSLYEICQFVEIFKFILKKNMNGSLHRNLILSTSALGCKYASWWLDGRNEFEVINNKIGYLTAPLSSSSTSRKFAGIKPQFEHLQCPLCQKRCRNPSLLIISGYIFCFKCLISHVFKYKNCPVTRLKVTKSDQIRRIFVLF